MDSMQWMQPSADDLRFEFLSELRQAGLPDIVIAQFLINPSDNKRDFEKIACKNTLQSVEVTYLIVLIVVLYSILISSPVSSNSASQGAGEIV